MKAPKIAVAVTIGTTGTGRVIYTCRERRWGFIRPSNVNLQLFYHESNVLFPVDDLKLGLTVQFTIGTGVKGPQALEIDIPQIAKTVTSALGVS